jgi:hypothetical protein
MRGAILAGVVAAFAATLCTPAFGASLQPWDGANPFVCTLQFAGQGTTFEHPKADPFCVDYDKTHQDVTELGLVTFLSKEPARVAAASNKCWYYQRDHWTGQIVAGDGSTQTYHFDGAYFFDKRWGNGGVHVENFTIGNQTADASQLPGFPASWKPYFGPGRGGVAFIGKMRTDPRCQAKPGPGHYSPYVDPGQFSGAPGSGAPHGGGTGHGGSGSTGGKGTPGHGAPGTNGKARSAACRKLSGRANNGIGRARLGMTRRTILRKLGKPTRRAHGFYHYCLRGRGELAVHFGKHGRADLAITNGRSFRAGRVRVGSSLARVRSSLHREQVLGHRKRNWLIAVSHRHWRLLVGLAKNRVVHLAAVSRRLSLVRVGKLLAGSGR